METQDTEWILRAIARESRNIRQAVVFVALFGLVQVVMWVLLLSGQIELSFSR